MPKYHISPKTGNAGQCRAKTNCPFGGAADHFDTKEAAQKEIEKRLSPLAVPAGAKKAASKPTAKEISARLTSIKSELSSLTTEVNKLSKDRGKWEKIGASARELAENMDMYDMPEAKKKEEIAILESKSSEAQKSVDAINETLADLKVKRGNLDREMQKLTPKPKPSTTARAYRGKGK